MKVTLKRVTVYFDPEIHRALCLMAAETDCSFSDLVNEAAQFSLAEGEDDLTVFYVRKNEPNLPYEVVVENLIRRGII